jgi:hypothetical protein
MMDRYRHGFGKPVQSQGRAAPLRAMARSARLALAMSVLAVALLMLTGCVSQPTRGATINPPIAIESIRMTAAGHYIDLRYRVLDPERANAALGPGIKPILIDEATGNVMAVPTTAKLGSLRQTQAEQRPDRTYFVLFVNSAPLRSGSRVTAELGELRFEHLTVQ